MRYISNRQLAERVPDPLEQVLVLTGPNSLVRDDFISQFRQSQRFLLKHLRAPLAEPAAIADQIQGQSWRPGTILVLIRGGGSPEDLAVFDDPRLVTSIKDCALPVFTAIGHRPNWTESDNAAAGAAITPTELGAMIAEAQYQQYMRQKRVPRPKPAPREPAPARTGYIVPPVRRLPPPVVTRPVVPPHLRPVPAAAWRSASRPNGLGVASLVLGLCSLVLALAGITPLIGLVLGIFGARRRPRRAAIAGIVINSIFLVGWVIFMAITIGSLGHPSASSGSDPGYGWAGIVSL